MATVIETIADNGLCVGCGVCAGMCPKNLLSIQWNTYGEYNPVRISKCGKECGICLKVCPFADGNPDEDEIGKLLFSAIPGIKHKSETGYYLGSGVGAVSHPERRLGSASGGLATWFFEKLLDDGIADTILCVKATGDSNRLFQFTIAKTKEEVYAAAGSAYYPVEMSDIVSYIVKNPGNYAVSGLPCFIKALRLAQIRNGVLQKRIVIMAGLTCGHLVSAHFIKYAAYCSGLSADAAYVRCRYKDPARPAEEYASLFTDIHGDTALVVWNEVKLMQMWAHMFLGLHACDCCDDAVAECADVTFMDAWLPEYSQNPLGTSLWISRSQTAEDILARGIASGELDAAPVPIEKVIESQVRTGVLARKRTQLHYRLNLMRNQGYAVPKKRVLPSSRPLSFSLRYMCKKDFQIQKLSRDVYLSCQGDGAYMREWFFDEMKDPLLIRGYFFSRSAFGYVLRKYGFWKK